MDKSGKLLNKKKHRKDSIEESEDDEQSLSDISYGKSDKKKNTEKSNKKSEKSESKNKNVKKSNQEHEDEEGIIVGSDEVTFMVR
jgi:hypothetical protein